MLKKGESPVPGYRLNRFLGRGQYGEVWQADAPGGTAIALKFIALNSRSGSIELKAVQAVKLIRHANLVPISAIWLLDDHDNVLDDETLSLAASTDFESTLSAEQQRTLDGAAFLVIAMSLADRSLDDRLKEAVEEGHRGIPIKELIEYMRQTARGLDFLNESRHEINGQIVGVTHRDVKPANLLLLGDSVAVGDFGVATTLKEFDATATTMVGSLGFMAPESLERRPSPTTDQYALAITYYWLRTNTLPYNESASVGEIMDVHRNGKLLFNYITDAEQKVLRKATALNPTSRFASCSEFIEELSESLNSKREKKSASGAPLLLIAGLLSMLLIGGIVLAVWQPWKTDETPNGLIGNADEQKIQINFVPVGITGTITVTDETGAQASHEISEAGTALFDAGNEDKILIETNAMLPLFPAMNREYTKAELQEAAFKIEVPKNSADGVRQIVFDQIDEGRESEAIETLVEASAEYDGLIAIQTAQTHTSKYEVLQMDALDSDEQFISVLMEGSRTLPAVITALPDLKLNVAPTPDKKLAFIERLLYRSDSEIIIVRTDSIWTWNPDSDEQQELVWKADDLTRITTAAFSENQQYLAIGDRDGAVRFWNLDSMKLSDEPVSKSIDEEAIVGLFVSDDGKIVSLSQDQHVRQIRVDTTNESWEIEPIDLPGDVENRDITHTIAAGEDRIVVALENELVVIENPFSMAPDARSIGTASDEIAFMRCSHNGLWLAVAAESVTSELAFWNLDDLKPISLPDAKTIRGIRDIAFHPTNNWAAIASEDGQTSLLKLNEQSTTELLRFPKTENGYRNLTRFSRDGKNLLSILKSAEGEERSTIEAWDFDRTRVFLKAATAPDATSD